MLVAGLDFNYQSINISNKMSDGGVGNHYQTFWILENILVAENALVGSFSLKHRYVRYFSNKSPLLLMIANETKFDVSFCMHISQPVARKIPRNSLFSIMLHSMQTGQSE